MAPARTPLPRKSVDTAAEASGRAPVTVLAVGSERDLLSLRHIFRHCRWTLVEATTLAEAAAHLREHSALVVISEAVLPDGTWAELLDHAQRRACPAPLIVTSWEPNGDLWSQVLERGGYNILGKPFCDQEVFEMVSVAWRHGTPAGAPAALRAAG